MPAPIFVDKIFRWSLAQRSKPLRAVGSHPYKIAGRHRVPVFAEPVNAAAFQHEQSVFHVMNLDHRQRGAGLVAHGVDRKIECRIGGDELALILPESRLVDAQRLATRIEQAVIARPVARAGHMRVSAGLAELQPNDDSTSLFERADQSLYATKQIRHSERGRGGGLAAAD